MTAALSSHAPFWKPLFLTCFHAPSRIQESLAFDDLVFQGSNLSYFEIEIPEPARDPSLTAAVLNFLPLPQLRKPISLLSFQQCTNCQEASIQGVFVKLVALSISPVLSLGQRSDDINLQPY